ncbi:ankyrin repeat domain-containing protein [Paenibacillus mendelii]|uniref:Ankyrin repeat domain-containing protein n=1 Tax=Paenibacillus mendelii TaxID=206163 RepID=A0ABV6J554_9BACL|nr:ankyrin repeat domain-containing protein [Paenibacillus mendelii]MCQ6561854.1 ankyrin repeat domain-containing protein [Paenibacillus mendelii]
MVVKKQSVVISIRLDKASLKAVDLLVESGLETNRSKAVTHFINVGVQSSEELLRKAQELADNVHQLKRDMVEAVKANDLDKVTSLSTYSDMALVNASTGNGETAVLMSAYYRANEIRKLLIDNGAQLSIFEAAAVGNTNRVKELLEKAPELHMNYSVDGFTPLGLAAHFGNEDTVRLLLEYGANVDARSKDGNLNHMAIHAAIAGNYEHVVKTLLESGADANVRCEGKWRPGYTPLHVAGHFGREAIIPVLLQHGANKSDVSDNGDTPYAVAMQQDHPEAAALLE